MVAKQCDMGLLKIECQGQLLLLPSFYKKIPKFLKIELNLFQLKSKILMTVNNGLIFNDQ